MPVDNYSGVVNEAAASLGSICINLMPVSAKLGFQTTEPLNYSTSAWILFSLFVFSDTLWSEVVQLVN